MFTTEMPSCHSPQHIKILRASGTKKIEGMLAGEPVTTVTHWYNGRTLPCAKSRDTHCPLCDKALSTRLYAYFPIRSGRGMIAAAELTPTAVEQLNDFLQHQPPMTIAIMTLSRQPGKRNNPLHVDVEFRPCSEAELDAYSQKYVDPNLLKRALCRLWGVPEYVPGIHEVAYMNKVSKYLDMVLEEKV